MAKEEEMITLTVLNATDPTARSAIVGESIMDIYANHLIVVNEQERKGSLLPTYTRVLHWEPNAVGVWSLVSGQ